MEHTQQVINHSAENDYRFLGCFFCVRINLNRNNRNFMRGFFEKKTNFTDRNGDESLAR